MNKNRIVLEVDTSNNQEIGVSLVINGKRDTVQEGVGRDKAQAVLPILVALLKKHKLQLKDITEISFNKGPGSFTGLRVGASVVNALGFFLNIPINGKKPQDLVEPLYE